MTALIPRIAPYPIMSPGGLDYADGHSYETIQLNDTTIPKDSIGVLHRVRGDNLVSQMLIEQRARFACTVVSPTSAYRSVQISGAEPKRTSQGIELTQQLQIVTDRFAYPVMFQPAVIAILAIDPVPADSSHGLDHLWISQAIEFPVAATLAVEPFWNAKTVLQSILRLKRVSDGSLKPGSFQVKETVEEGFYFLVEAEERLFNGLRNPASFDHRNSIYAMALSQGLQILNQRFREQETWTDYQNLKLLYQMLKAKNVPTWDEDDFKANQVAAAFHPHEVKLALHDEID